MLIKISIRCWRRRYLRQYSDKLNIYCTYVISMEAELNYNIVYEILINLFKISYNFIVITLSLHRNNVGAINILFLRILT